MTTQYIGRVVSYSVAAVQVVRDTEYAFTSQYLLGYLICCRVYCLRDSMNLLNKSYTNILCVFMSTELLYWHISVWSIICMCIDFFQILVRVGSGLRCTCTKTWSGQCASYWSCHTLITVFKECGEMLTENGDKHRNVHSLGLNEIARELFSAESYQSSLEVNASS